LAAQFQSIDQKPQWAALRRFPKKTPRDGAVTPAWTDLLIVHKSAHSTRFAGLLGRAGKFVGHLRQMNVLRAVQTCNKPGQVSMPGFSKRRQVLLNQSFHPILQTQAVAHRDGSVGQRRSYL
jgi:hypothetical protein